MDSSNEGGIELKFAKKLVAVMLTRHGTVFEDGGAHRFLIRDGARTLALLVKHSNDMTMEQAQLYWHNETPSLIEGDAVDASENHVVIVSGQGYDIYTDQRAANYLCCDVKTRLHVVDGLTMLRFA